MIDTISISIPANKILHCGELVVQTGEWFQQRTSRGVRKYVRNKTKEEKGCGIYFPKIEKIQRFRKGCRPDYYYKIEFSAPKIVFGNNLDEVEEGDFSVIVERLKETLSRMGIKVTIEDLRAAQVNAVHFSKNMQLTNGYTAQFVIAELNKIDARKSFDITKTKYTNNGQCLSFHTGAHSFIVYDKIADLANPHRRATDKDQTPFQRSLFNRFKNSRVYEIIRFEVRLCNKRKLEEVLNGLNYPRSPTLEDIFETKLSQRVLKDYWKKFVEGSVAVLFGAASNHQDVLKTILASNLKIKPKTALYLAGLISVSRESEGMRGVRAILNKYCDQRTWYRIKADYEKISTILKTTCRHEWLSQIQGGLDAYSAHRVESQKPLNNVVM